MHTHSNIRSWYRPVQPTVKEKGAFVAYREILPDYRLQNGIYCYWELKTTERLLNPFIYRVVADGCIDIFFSLQNPTESYVMGFCKSYTEFPLNGTFHYVGIRFLPTGFPTFFNVDAKQISNREEKLAAVSKDTSEFVAHHFPGRYALPEIKLKLDQYFIDLLNKSEVSVDKRFANALDIILQNNGEVNITKDLDTGLSERQLRRYFDFYIGDSAKTFSRVVRFQKIFTEMSSNQALNGNKLFYDLGYYDQPHFIKEFKKFYGLTPSKVLGR